jgi:hypothetical protein
MCWVGAPYTDNVLETKLFSSIANRFYHMQNVRPRLDGHVVSRC